MEYTIPQANWTRALADLTEKSNDGDVIIVHSEEQKELAERAKSRMCPEKKVEFRVGGGLTSVLMEPLAKNVFSCPYCQGPVDRYDRLFECRNCKAFGDLVTGIMSPVERLGEADADAPRRTRLLVNEQLLENELDAKYKAGLEVAAANFPVDPANMTMGDLLVSLGNRGYRWNGATWVKTEPDRLTGK